MVRKPLHNEQGVVGLVILGIVVIGLIIYVAMYVYRVRRGEAAPMVDVSALTRWLPKP